MAHATPDDGFHEIQLNGKQLVFLFMAATVVSVVIFLCGVLVGRGVRAERSSATEASSAGDATPADIAPNQPPMPAAPPAASADPTAAAPPPPAEDLSYFKRLEAPKQPQEDLKAVVPKTAAAPRAAPDAAPGAPAASAPPAPATSAKAGAPAKKPAPVAAASDASTSTSADLQPPATPGYAVQIAALSVRSEADTIAKHLAAKGYAAYVAANGSPAIYRVRVGTFKTRREAESVAAKLQKEEQLKPFVTR